MAVPFYLPEQDDDSYAGSPNTTTSATQTPLQSPVSGEHLVQAFCEALYRCSINGSPGFQFPPPSPSCSTNNSPNGGYYGGEVFFPRGRTSTTTATATATSTPRSPRAPTTSLRDSDDGVFFRLPPRTPMRTNAETSRRSRLTSTGDDDYDDECHSEHETSLDDELDERYGSYMVARERLQEFSGRIPPRKKKTTAQKPKSKVKDKSLSCWPTVVTVFVFAVGCGFLVTR